MSCDERFIAESDSTCDEQESWGCDCSGCECDGCASEVVLYEGATSGYGADLDVIVDQGVWDAGYTLALSFTMPDDLSAIGDWDGLLGNDDGGHPYPYFNQDGLWFEIQNGPHPNEGGLSLDRFTRGESYTVIIEHWMYDGTHCFRMYIDGTDASFDGTDASEWCYDYTYSSTPLYAGCGYGKDSETFSGSVTRITLDTHSCDDNDHGEDGDTPAYVAVHNKGCSDYIHMDNGDYGGVDLEGGSTSLEECAAAVQAYSGQDGCMGNYFFFEDAGYCNCPTDDCSLDEENHHAGSDGQLYMFTGNVTGNDEACPATCFGEMTCDAWIEVGDAGSCEDIETWEMGDGSYCDCSGCNCANTPSPTSFPSYSPTTKPTPVANDVRHCWEESCGKGCTETVCETAAPTVFPTYSPTHN